MKIATFGISLFLFCFSLTQTGFGNEDICSEQNDFVETQHTASIGGKEISYNTTVGSMPLNGAHSKLKANIFFISYERQGSDKPRPVTFCFNGGPGSSSVWIHMGFAGPKKVYFNESGEALPPYQLENNESSLLDITDLVFIDPVSTGYSTPASPDEEKAFHGVASDVESIAEFIRLYLSKFNRWDSPKFLMGESYGTIRATALAEHLHNEEFIYTNGIILISSVLNFQSIDFQDGNDLPYQLFLPTYTATAWYHQKLGEELQKDFSLALKEAEDFVATDYTKALFKGDLLSLKEKKGIAEKFASLTGLSPDYIERNNLRVDIFQFTKELLRDENRTLGRFNSTQKGIEQSSLGERIRHDPSFESLAGAFTATFNSYIKGDLGFCSDEKYKIITNVFPWNWGCDNKSLNVSQNLWNVMTKNPSAKVFVASGYYDLATPFFATAYTFNHLGLDPSLKDHVTLKNYPGGHMMYLNPETLIELKKDLVKYYEQTLAD